MKKAILAATLAFAAIPFLAQAEDVVRHKMESDFPISKAVEVPAGKTTVYVSGMVPSVADPAADQNSAEAWGDTKTQTISVLNNIQEALKGMDLTMGDVVKMQVFLVAPTGTDEADFKGFMEGYTQFFGTADQPNLPARSAMTVAKLVNPGWLVEIEVTAVRP